MQIVSPPLQTRRVTRVAQQRPSRRGVGVISVRSSCAPGDVTTRCSACQSTRFRAAAIGLVWFKVGGLAILLTGLGLPFFLLSGMAAGAEPPVSDAPPVPGAAGTKLCVCLIEAPMQVGQRQHALDSFDPKSMKLEGKIALVTGANTGIGRFTALHLARGRRYGLDPWALCGAHCPSPRRNPFGGRKGGASHRRPRLAGDHADGSARVRVSRRRDRHRRAERGAVQELHGDDRRWLRDDRGETPLHCRLAICSAFRIGACVHSPD
jgi:hypothetical protein